MVNQDIFDQCIQDFLQPNNNCVRLKSTAFIDSYSTIIPTNYEEITTFVRNTYSSNIARSLAVSILSGPRVSISIKDIMFELKGRYLCNALPGEATTNDIGVDKINIL